MTSGGVRSSALVPAPSEEGTITTPGRAMAASSSISEVVASGTSMGARSTVRAPNDMARRAAASAEWLWLRCSCSSKTSAPERRAWWAAAESLVTTTTRSRLREEQSVASISSYIRRARRSAGQE